MGFRAGRAAAPRTDTPPAPPSPPFPSPPMPPPVRPAVTAAWRDYVQLLRRLPPSDAAERRAKAADAVRANAALTGADADDALKRLHAAIADIAATTARRAGERRRLISAGTYVVRDGQAVKVERGGGSGSRAVGAGRLTPDEAVANHRALLKRQHFGREPPRGPSLF